MTYAHPFIAPESRDWTPAEYEVARLQAHQYLMTTAIEIPMDAFLDDVTDAMGRDYPLFIESLQKQDDAEAGGLVRDALSQCALRYLDTEAGQLLIEDFANGCPPK